MKIQEENSNSGTSFIYKRNRKCPKFLIRYPEVHRSTANNSVTVCTSMLSTTSKRILSARFVSNSCDAESQIAPVPDLAACDSLTNPCEATARNRHRPQPSTGIISKSCILITSWFVLGCCVPCVGCLLHCTCVEDLWNKIISIKYIYIAASKHLMILS